MTSRKADGLFRLATFVLSPRFRLGLMDVLQIRYNEQLIPAIRGRVPTGMKFMIVFSGSSNAYGMALAPLRSLYSS